MHDISYATLLLLGILPFFCGKEAYFFSYPNYFLKRSIKASSDKIKTSFCICTEHAALNSACYLNHNQSCFQWHPTLIFLQIKDTIGFDTLGHCFFLEDGVEQRNTLFHNLGLLTKPGTLLPTDRNNSMCTTMREKVFGNYVPVPATDCMWVVGREKNSCMMIKDFDVWGVVFSGQDFSWWIFKSPFKNTLQGCFNFLDCSSQQ